MLWNAHDLNFQGLLLMVILKRLKDQGYTFQTVSSSETSNLKDATLGLHPLPLFSCAVDE